MTASFDEVKKKSRRKKEKKTFKLLILVVEFLFQGAMMYFLRW